MKIEQLLCAAEGGANAGRQPGAGDTASSWHGLVHVRMVRPPTDSARRGDWRSDGRDLLMGGRGRERSRHDLIANQDRRRVLTLKCGVHP